MAVPNAPMSLWRQVAMGTNVTITFTLQGLSTAAQGFTPGTAYNAGNPTCTVTIPLSPGPTSGSFGANNPLDEQIPNLFEAIEDLIQKGTATAV